jgi:peptidoglycan hydrolase-like protein with peptidoglycan-binding domain
MFLAVGLLAAVAGWAGEAGAQAVAATPGNEGPAIGPATDVWFVGRPWERECHIASDSPADLLRLSLANGIALVPIYRRGTDGGVIAVELSGLDGLVLSDGMMDTSYPFYRSKQLCDAELTSPSSQVASTMPSSADGTSVPSRPAKMAPRQIGPSFPCPALHDPLGYLLCNDPELARAEIQYIQAYQALKQQSLKEEAKSLIGEANGFTVATRLECDIPAPGARQVTKVPRVDHECLAGAYARQRNLLLSRLRDAAAEEAMRPIEQHFDLQAALLRKGFLTSSTEIDGIYGTRTRAAIMAWQRATGRSPTGIMGADDASALLTDGAGNAVIPMMSLAAADQGDGSVLSSALGLSLSQLRATYPHATCFNNICTFEQVEIPQQLCPNIGTCRDFSLFIQDDHVTGYLADIDAETWRTSIEHNIALRGQPTREVIGPSEPINIRTEIFSWRLSNGLDLNYIFTSGRNIYGAPVSGYSISVSPKTVG